MKHAHMPASEEHKCHPQQMSYLVIAHTKPVGVHECRCNQLTSGIGQDVFEDQECCCQSAASMLDDCNSQRSFKADQTSVTLVSISQQASKAFPKASSVVALNEINHHQQCKVDQHPHGFKAHRRQIMDCHCLGREYSKKGIAAAIKSDLWSGNVLISVHPHVVPWKDLSMSLLCRTLTLQDDITFCSTSHLALSLQDDLSGQL